MRSQTICGLKLRSKIKRATSSCEAANLPDVEWWPHQKRQPLPRPHFSDLPRQSGRLVGTLLRRQQNQIIRMGGPKAFRVIHAARCVNFDLVIPQDIGPQGLLGNI